MIKLTPNRTLRKKLTCPSPPPLLLLVPSIYLNWNQNRRLTASFYFNLYLYLYLLFKIVSNAHAQLVQLIPLLCQADSAVFSVSKTINEFSFSINFCLFICPSWYRLILWPLAMKATNACFAITWFYCYYCLSYICTIELPGMIFQALNLPII